MKDEYGDKITVETTLSGKASINFESDDHAITMILCPAKTRKLIRKLKAALDD